MELREATSDELLEELGTRFAHIAVVMDGPFGSEQLVRRWTKDNDAFAAAGLCLWAAQDFVKMEPLWPDDKSRHARCDDEDDG